VPGPLKLGNLSELQHQVSGEVWLLTKKILEIRNFNYDGTAPATYFWVDTSAIPSGSGMVIPDGSPSLGCALSSADPPLPAASNVTQLVEFPGDLTIDDFLGGSLSVWCENFSANFGDLVFPAGLPLPIPYDGPDLECGGGGGGGEATHTTNPP
jgi:Electron transfer DM13